MTMRCVLEARSVLGEGVLWSPGEGLLYWIDQMRPEIHRFDPESGLDERLAIDLPEQLGALVPRSRGGFVLAASDGLSLVDAAACARTPLANPIAARLRASFNDAKVNRDGTLFAGTTDRLERDPIGELFSLVPAGMPLLLADGFVCSNGPSFSPDGRILYHTRSHDREIWAYETGPGGTIGRGGLFARVGADEGIPDGSTVDAEGHLWSTHWDGGRITRYRPDGRIERVVETPCRSPTSCAFGGPALGTLFVTSASISMKDGEWVRMGETGFVAEPTAGGIFAFEPGVDGLPEPAFPG